MLNTNRMVNAYGSTRASHFSHQSTTLVGTYTYDTWGKVISSTPASGTSDPNGILAKNPFRYRGYYLDDETGFYYLQSRYYDPEVKRFINADGLISTGTGVTGYNMYAYCNNNPVNGYDPTGMCVYDYSGTYDCNSARCPTSKSYIKPVHDVSGTYYPTPGGTTSSTPPPPAAPLIKPQSGVDIIKVDYRLIFAVFNIASKYNITITITSGYRNREQQQILWDASKERGTPGWLGPKTPVASPDNAPHCKGQAIDISIPNITINYNSFGLYVIKEDHCHHLELTRH